MSRKPFYNPNVEKNEGEFLWLVSLSDLMILLFVFFVVLFSFSFKKMSRNDFQKISASLRSEKESVAPLDQIQAKLLKWVVDKDLLQGIEVQSKDDALIINIKEKVLFASGAWALSDEGTELVNRIGDALIHIPSPYRIGVEGHTDDQPFHGKGAVQDNWQLSALRARSVLKALNLSQEASQRAMIIGYGEMRPLAPNQTPDKKPIPENQASNRRVTLRIF